MMRISNLFLIIFLFFCISLSSAHVTLLQPQGGETFTVGSTMHIIWDNYIKHGEGSWELYYSKDGGINFSTVDIINIDVNVDTAYYNWEIPESAITNNGIIRVIQNNTTYQNFSDDSGLLTISTVSGINDKSPPILKSFKLYDAYPNPFNGATVISFELDRTSNIEVNIFNITGRKIDTILKNRLPQGLNKVIWNPRNIPSGIYFYTVQSGLNNRTGRLVYIK